MGIILWLVGFIAGDSESLAHRRLSALLGAARGEFLPGTPERVRPVLQRVARRNFGGAFFLLWKEGRFASPVVLHCSRVAEAVWEHAERVTEGPPWKPFPGWVAHFWITAGFRRLPRAEQDLILLQNYLNLAGGSPVREEAEPRRLEVFAWLACGYVASRGYGEAERRLRAMPGLDGGEREIELTRLAGRSEIFFRHSVEEVVESVAARCRYAAKLS